MKKLVALMCMSAAALVAFPSAADEESSSPGSFTLKTITIVGRPNMPHVVIELSRPTPAIAARAAHDEMHARLTAASAPPALSH
jgi:hypothetical protein